MPVMLVRGERGRVGETVGARDVVSRGGGRTQHLRCLGGREYQKMELDGVSESALVLKK